MDQLADIDLPPLFHGRYNVAPTQKIPVIKQTNPNHSEECVWGFKNLSLKSTVINARFETLTERPMFRDLISTNRCLIPADGFYEWEGKQPYYFQLMDKKIFGFAGLWKDGRCVILTKAADSNMHGIHNRMPIIITFNHWTEWLENLKTPKVTPSLLVHPISRRVNKVSHDDPACLNKGEVQIDLSLFPYDG